ncbi:MAG: poly-gamma-glutamate hydrolase family protein [Candidatus Paceibacterota bacterium]
MVEEFPNKENERMSYNSFADLVKSEIQGEDFDIQIEKRDSQIAFFAPHGGKIEPGTTEIVHYLAGNEYSFYSFVGKKGSNNFLMHISSNSFDEPQALELAKSVDRVITIHGMKGNDVEKITLGGLDKELILKVKQQLLNVDFPVEIADADSTLKGVSIENICNKGNSGKGLQIEISRMLRQKLVSNEIDLERFRRAIMNSIQ